MASTKFFLDSRQVSDCNPAPLKVAIRNNNSTAYINTGVKLMPNQWDAVLNKVVNNPLKQQYNARISKFKSEIDILIFDLAREQGIAKWKASALKKEIEHRLSPDDENVSENTFMDYALKFIETKNVRTKEIYEATVSRIKAFDANFEEMTFEDVTVEW